MKLMRVLLTLTALTAVAVEASIRIPSAFTSFLPFTFNVTSDDTGLGSVTLTIKPRLGRENHEIRVRRSDLNELNEKTGRVLFNTAQWELGLPSGAGLTAGAVSSLAGLIWTVISKSLKYKKEHGELEGWKGGAKVPPSGQPASPAGHPAPSYGSSYPAPEYHRPTHHKKPEKGFFKGVDDLKGMQIQAIKGFTKMIGLKDLKKLLRPEGKSKKRPVPQYQQHAYAPAYAPEYAPYYAPAPAPEYSPPPSYAPAPTPEYAPPPSPPAYAPPPTEVTSYAQPPPPTYPSPPAETPAPSAYNQAPVQEVPANNPPPGGLPNPPEHPMPVWGTPHGQRNSKEILSNMPSPAEIITTPPAAFVSSPVAPQTVPISSLIQSNDFLPIIPSPVDPLPFMPSPNLDPQQQTRHSEANSAAFGIPPRDSRVVDATLPLDLSGLRSIPENPSSNSPWNPPQDIQLANAPWISPQEPQPTSSVWNQPQEFQPTEVPMNPLQESQPSNSIWNPPQELQPSHVLLSPPQELQPTTSVWNPPQEQQSNSVPLNPPLNFQLADSPTETPNGSQQDPWDLSQDLQEISSWDPQREPKPSSSQIAKVPIQFVETSTEEMFDIGSNDEDSDDEDSDDEDSDDEDSDDEDSDDEDSLVSTVPTLTASGMWASPAPAGGVPEVKFV